jgi:hypothetical protein
MGLRNDIGVIEFVNIIILYYFLPKIRIRFLFHQILGKVKSTIISTNIHSKPKDNK